MPLLVLHDAWLSQRMWQPQISAFSGDFRVVSCDLRGHGESEITDAPCSIELLGEDVIQLMTSFVERFMCTVKEEHVDYSEYRDFEDTYQQLKHWLEVVYMTERIHEALDYITSAEFEAVALAGRYTLLNSA